MDHGIMHNDNAEEKSMRSRKRGRRPCSEEPDDGIGNRMMRKDSFDMPTIKCTENPNCCTSPPNFSAPTSPLRQDFSEDGPRHEEQNTQDCLSNPSFCQPVCSEAHTCVQRCPSVPAYSENPRPQDPAVLLQHEGQRAERGGGKELPPQPLPGSFVALRVNSLEQEELKLRLRLLELERQAWALAAAHHGSAEAAHGDLATGDGGAPAADTCPPSTLLPPSRGAYPASATQLVGLHRLAAVAGAALPSPRGGGEKCAPSPVAASARPWPPPEDAPALGAARAEAPPTAQRGPEAGGGARAGAAGAGAGAGAGAAEGRGGGREGRGGKKEAKRAYTLAVKLEAIKMHKAGASWLQVAQAFCKPDPRGNWHNAIKMAKSWEASLDRLLSSSELHGRALGSIRAEDFLAKRKLHPGRAPLLPRAAEEELAAWYRAATGSAPRDLPKKAQQAAAAAGKELKAPLHWVKLFKRRWGLD